MTAPVQIDRELSCSLIVSRKIFDRSKDLFARICDIAMGIFSMINRNHVGVVISSLVIVIGQVVIGLRDENSITTIFTIGVVQGVILEFIKSLT